MKALLIEDRKERQELFLKEFNLNFENYKNVLLNAIDDKYKEILNFLKNEEYDFLDEFDVIISHKSAFDDLNAQIIYRLENYAKDIGKKLVFFSGGIDSIYYYKENDFEHLELNSMLFYSRNLIYFLDELKDDKLNILILAYGKKWKLNIYIEILDKIAKYIQEMTKDKTLFKIFYKKTNLENLINLGFKINFDKREITKQEMIEIKNKLAYHIEEMLKYENYNT
jgi:hypothetical protein